MYYTIYQITNLINNKIYIGRHRTKDIDDSYMSSSLLVKQSIEKYGIDNFKKEILHVFDNEQDMINKESEIVTESFCKRNDVYNVSIGGLGTSNFIHKEIAKKASLKGNLTKSKLLKDQNWRAQYSKKMSESQRKYYEKNDGHFKGKKHSNETRKRMSDAKKGKYSGNNNPSYGSMWITNGLENKKIKKIDFIPEGWYKGRTISNLIV